MSNPTPAATAASAPAHDSHRVALLPCFMALLLLTAGEVAIFEVWSHTHFVSKLVMVLMLLVLTLPKAAIVLIYFMHLKFESQGIILLAVAPLVLVGVCMLPTLLDAVVLKGENRTDNVVPGLSHWVPPHSPGGHGAHTPEPSHGQH